jgi:quinol-cytochrome oxidoreductase complex cytochrome b subunit
MSGLDFGSGESERTGRWLATSTTGLIVLFTIQWIVGWVLHSHYTPTLVRAYRSVEAMHSHPVLAFVENWHFWGGALLIVFSFLHLAAMIWCGWYRPPHTYRWIAAILLFASALLLQITGNLLSMDRHAIQTTVVEAGIAGRVPAAGALASQMVLLGDAFSQNTLQGWYWAHRLVPILALIAILFTGVTQWMRRDFREYWVAALIPLVLSVGLATSIESPLGTRGTAADFTMYDALPGWYVWPMHGSLRMWESINPSLGWVGSAVVPGLFGLLLVSLPIFAKKFTDTAARMIFSGFVLYFGASAVIFGSAPANPFGDRESHFASQTPTVPTEKPQVTIDPALFAKGRDAFNQSCAGCHGTDGRNGKGGPPMDQVWSKHSDPDWYVRFIKNPGAVKPGSTMPGFPDLSADTLQALAEFLRSPDRPK